MQLRIWEPLKIEIDSIVVNGEIYSDIIVFGWRVARKIGELVAYYYLYWAICLKFSSLIIQACGMRGSKHKNARLNVYYNREKRYRLLQRENYAFGCYHFINIFCYFCTEVKEKFWFIRPNWFHDLVLFLCRKFLSLHAFLQFLLQ